MKHKQFEEWLQLSLYNELNKREQEVLNNHLTTCERCRVDLSELKKIHSMLAHRQPVVVEESSLQEVRRSLRLRIHDISAQKSMWMKMQSTIDGMLAPSFQIALGVVMTFMIGILVGYFVFKSPSEKNLALRQAKFATYGMETGESQITNIHFVDRNVQNGDVEFTFETITPMRIYGNVNDESVQKVLLALLLVI